MSMHEVAQAMVAKPKGILAMDESMGTIGKRFDSVGVENTEENRQAYREMIITTPELENYVSGTILFEETLFQSTKDGVPFVKVLQEKGIIPGIKVDQGAKDSSPGEKLTTGLQGLDERMKKYAAQGAKFAKWRAVITISENTPTDANTEEDMDRLAQYAKICQDNEVVPIVEPEVLMDGNHSLERKKEVTLKTLKTLYARMEAQGVDLKGTVLKPNMVVQGKELGPSPVETVAKETVAVLKEAVPSDVPGIAFLSGGIDDEHAVKYLAAMNKMDTPWNLTFSYSRALLNTALKAFGTGDTEQGQQNLLERAKACSGATQ